MRTQQGPFCWEPAEVCEYRPQWNRYRYKYSKYMWSKSSVPVYSRYTYVQITYFCYFWASTKKKKLSICCFDFNSHFLIFISFWKVYFFLMRFSFDIFFLLGSYGSGPLFLCWTCTVNMLYLACTISGGLWILSYWYLAWVLFCVWFNSI